MKSGFFKTQKRERVLFTHVIINLDDTISENSACLLVLTPSPLY